ncbi:DNA-binding response regulator, OmpR family, contains REC and winged-helix (wHTH) domain [Pseudoxanthomonas sp. CF385]|uniref:response regulator transcription factor n=1 Tax=Pseudoxanthomonas sp. CF385 TaxID=1881042 RepID=UPI0008896F76|nr:response regulator transcription factor [Pseudoxanthomonas sp. CF385]SDQ66949.1 DNA-binding response regulator, OmpR family, contains REC and winged-helix (wHTH) domain [Pseudoxanthomonas sp. CF385]
MSVSAIILIIEDNRGLAETVGTYLETRGMEVDYAADGEEGYRLAAENRYDAIVLDGHLPRMDGLDVVRTLRNVARVATPIIMVTGRDTLEDKLAGLDQGVDDYLTKPFATQELEARLTAVIRRNRKELGREVLKVGDLSFDPSCHRMRRGDRELELSPVATKLLNILMRESPRVVTRREIEREIWGDDLPDSDTLRSHLYNLRKAIDRGFDEPLLHTVQSAGYRLAEIGPSRKAGHAGESVESAAA